CFTPEKNRIADDIASQIINLLEAHHASGLRRVRRLSRNNGYRRLINNKIYGPETINRILARIPKHLT
ncbi:MAG: hypothetical protein HYU99_11775, partial [Deltaproteobacteria bacterium]|nr:hypothetical protein [Deltaproteobacteria bacterium]